METIIQIIFPTIHAHLNPLLQNIMIQMIMVREGIQALTQLEYQSAKNYHSNNYSNYTPTNNHPSNIPTDTNHYY